MKYILCLFFLSNSFIYIFCLENSLIPDGILFRYKYQLRDLFKYEGSLLHEISLNGKIILKQKIYNTICAHVINKINDWSTLESNYRSFIENSPNLARLISSEKSRYSQSEKGEYRIQPKFMFPAVRSIPSFPQKPVKIGESWQAQAEEKFDLNFLNAGKVAAILKVQYTYTGIVKEKDNIYHKILITYSPNLNKGTVSIRGNVRQTLYWDNKIGNIARYEDNYDFSFSSGSNIYRYKGESEGVRIILKNPLANNQQIIEEISQKILSLQIPFISLIEEDKSIKIILNDAYFEKGLPYISPLQEENLIKLSSIIKAYPLYSLIIEGFYISNQKSSPSDADVSDERAFRIGEFLINYGIQTKGPLIFRGMGQGQVNSLKNSTLKSKDRKRIEITLLFY